ncbi:hypothetical protein Hanom_Chr12g01149691 [Helianthus anomalus]
MLSPISTSHLIMRLFVSQFLVNCNGKKVLTIPFDSRPFVQQLHAVMRIPTSLASQAHISNIIKKNVETLMNWGPKALDSFDLGRPLE